MEPQDAGGGVGKVAFGSELDRMLRGEGPRDENFSILVNSAEGDGDVARGSDLLVVGGGGGGVGGGSPVETNSVHVWGVRAGSGDLAGFDFMDQSPQFIDTNQDFVSDGHPDVISRGLTRNKDIKAKSQWKKHTGNLKLDAHVLVAHVEDEGVPVFVLVLSSLTPGPVPGEMAVDEQIDDGKRFDVLQVSRGAKLHVTASIEGCGKRELGREEEADVFNLST